MGTDLLQQAFTIGFLAAAVRMATPVLLAALGEVFAERSGVLNIGLEGIMLMGALMGFVGAYFTGSVWWGALIAVTAGVLMSMIHAFLCVNLCVDQVVSGIALNVLSLGLSGFLFREIFGLKEIPTTITGFQEVKVPMLSQIPFIGPILFQQTALTYIALLLVPLFSFILFKTYFGISLTAAGENPKAGQAIGLSITRLRYVGVLMSGALAGLGGAFLSTSQLNLFRENLVVGRGFIALAVVIIGRWNPYGVLLGALLFGVADALQLAVQAVVGGLPYQFLLMFPYIVTILTLLGFRGRRSAEPSSLGRPYRSFQAD